MKKLVYLLLALTLFGCKPKSKEPVKKKSAAELRSEYLKKALESDEYKNAFMNIKRVNDSLDLFKKRPIDTTAVIYEYNTTIATATGQVKNISQVVKEMKKDTAYLKAAQLKVAADLALADSTNMKVKN